MRLSTNKAYAFALFIIAVIASQGLNNAGFSIPAPIINSLRLRAALLFGYSASLLHRSIILAAETCTSLGIKKIPLVVRIVAKVAEFTGDIFQNLKNYEFSDEGVKKASNSIINYVHCVSAGIGMTLILGKPYENASKIRFPFFIIIPVLCKIEKMRSKIASLEDSNVSICEISLRLQAKMINLICCTFLMLGHPSRSAKIINAVAIPIMVIDLATDIADSLNID